MHNDALPRLPRLKISPNEHARKLHKHSYRRRAHQHRIERHNVLLLNWMKYPRSGMTIIDTDQITGTASSLPDRFSPIPTDP
jgi:hypothetical protein